MARATSSLFEFINNEVIGTKLVGGEIHVS